MARPVTVRSLLREAELFLNRSEARIPVVKGPPWRWFRLGGTWMRDSLAELRSRPPAPVEVDFSRLGSLKYALAGAPAMLLLVPGALAGSPLLLLAGLILFYAIESRLVFLFPVAIDGSSAPFRDSRILAAKAGPAGEVMRVVMGLAAVMVFGGFVTGRWLRCWTLGCLSVLIWYEKTRAAD